MGYFLWSKTVGGDDIGGISGSWRSICMIIMAD